jgi:anhydro-N-acetylmuramic acid kinase
LEQPLAVLNLGGVGNITYLSPGAVIAFDTGPGNALIDDWMERHTGARCDISGETAAQGRVDAARLAALLDDDFFAVQPPKSLDRNQFSATPVDGLTLADGAAPLTAFTAHSVARALPHLPAPPRRVLVTGGGRHNPVVMAMLREALGLIVDPVETVGWNGDALEAQAFAHLAVRSLRGLPLSLPSTTGVARPTTGGVHHRALSAA